MDVESLARGLTKAGQEALNWVRPCSIIATYRRGAAEVERLGLVQRDGIFFTITPLGLAVREYLKGTQNGK